MSRPSKLVLLAASALSISALGSARALAHGDLTWRIAEATADIERELKKPVDGHERAKVFLARGELYRLSRLWEKATRDYDLAQAYDPKLPAIPLARGRMFFESGRPAQARSILEDFLRLFPGHPQALALHGQVLVALGFGARAVESLDRALEQLDQPEPDHYLARADILAGLGGKQLPRALQGLDQGIARLGPLVSLDTRAIELELALGHYDRALRRIDRQAAATIRKDIWLARRAEVLDRAGRRRQARDARQEALRIMTTLPAHLQARPATLQLRQRLLATSTPVARP